MKKGTLFFLITLMFISLLGLQIVRQKPNTRPTSAHFFDRRPRQMVYIYPDQGKFAPAYRNYAKNIQSRIRYFSIRALPASAKDTLSQPTRYVYLGKIQNQPALQKLMPHLPFSVNPSGFEINHFRYTDKRDVLNIRFPYPQKSGQSIQIITGNDDRAILDYLNDFQNPWRLPGNYTIFRKANIIAYGFLNYENPEAPKVDPSREQNFLQKRKLVFQDDFFAVNYIGKRMNKARLRTFLERQKKLLLDQFQQLDISAKDRQAYLPIQFVLYETAESKTIATGDSRFSSWQPGEKKIHIVFNDRVRGDDYTAIAEYVGTRWAGAIPNDLIRKALGVLFSDHWGGEGYPVWAGRLFFNDLFLPVEELFATNESAAVSPYIAGPQLATFLQFILFHDGAKSLRSLLRRIPAEMTAGEIKKFFPQHILDLWNRWCRAMLKDSTPPEIKAKQDFIKGFCYAHEGYSIYNGYMGSTSRQSLGRLAGLGVNAISITPFGYTRDPKRPVPFGRSTRPGSENDESLIVAASFARNLGMTVMLKPHILMVGRGHWGWPGNIEMADPGDWPEFFKQYKRWISHYAILAQMYRFDSFCIGVELSKTTVNHEKEWRQLIGQIRKLYGGPMTYAANWGEEFENIGFWDALDYVGVNSYYPLAKDSTANPEVLFKGAEAVAEKIQAVGKKFQKPVLLTEIGFASRPASWIDPHRDGRSARPDEKAQSIAYEAIFRAFYRKPWLAGFYWWKWPTVLDDGGRDHAGFTPNGKAAEEVVRKWYMQK